MIKGIVFDMDGLMFDTERLINRGWYFAGRQAGYDITEETVFKTLGLDLGKTRRVFLEDLGEDLDFDAIDTVRVDFINDFIEKNGVPMKPGLIELLDFLKSNRYKMTVATSTDRKKAAHLFQKAGISPYFDDIVCGDMVEHGKPEPDIYLKACQLIGVAPGECLALEDSLMGIQSAYSAGMKPVMIPDLVEPDSETIKRLYARLPSLFDVIDLLNKQSETD